MIIDFIYKNWIEILGASFGLLYLYYEYKASLKMWSVGIAMSLFYTVVFIESKFYAFACINIYYIIAGIYGWIKWQRSRKEDVSQQIALKNTPTRLYLPIMVVISMLFLLVVYLLINYTDTQVAYSDAIITTLSIVAMWMLAQRYVEQWILLIIVNFISTIVYLYNGLYPTSIMYSVYAIVSIFGYLRWKKLANSDKTI